MVNLVADIGGTNSRFAVCEPGSVTLREPRKYPNKDFTSLQDVIAHYLSDAKVSPTAACIAIAGPIHGDLIKLTNIDWSFRISEMKAQFKLDELRVTNDFTALAMSIPHLSEESYAPVGGGAGVAHQPIAVLGPGTGLGVSALFWNDGWHAINSEGGNVGFAPMTDLEVELHQRALKEKDYVRAEDFISGNGLTFLHDLLCDIDGTPREGLAAKDITWRAKTSDCDRCRQTIDIFCGMLGSFAGNAALTFCALGGVYIGGGVTPQLEELFLQSDFRARFEAKGPFTDYVRAIPTYLLHSHSRNALIGAAAMLTQPSHKKAA